eukprot:14317887-Ditylum_brightwellii.AAC.1
MSSDLNNCTGENDWRCCPGRCEVNIFDIISSIRTHYINNKSDFDKLDPKDAAIIALTSK